jgi:cholesterol oxidase
MVLGKDAYAAIVVGSGFGGAVAACRLAQAGVDVGILERGLRFPLGGFPRHTVRADLLDWRNGGPYDVRPFADMFVVQGAGYGGGSLIYANVQVRPPAEVFAAGWPGGYTRASLDPYYDLVAHMLDIEPVAEDPATGELPPKTRQMEAAVSRLGRGAQSFRPNLAVRFEGAGQAPAPNKFGALQSGCLHCGDCDIGCNVGAKNTLDLNYLHIAEQHGAEVATEAEVTWLAPEEGRFRLRYRDHAEGGGEATVSADHVFLCLGTVNSTELLLRCRDQHRTLPSLSARLGHGYSANGDFLALGLRPSEPFGATRGPTITTAYVHEREQDGRRIRLTVEDGGYSTRLARLLPFTHPVRLAQIAGRELRSRLAHEPHEVTALLQGESDTTVVLLVMGNDRSDGTLELARPHHRLRLRWDTPSNLDLYSAETAACRELIEALGGHLALMPNWSLLGQPSAPHNLGGCRMGSGSADGVVDADGRVFGYPGLHVLDGAVIPGAVGVNPSHTIAAVAERNIEATIRRMPGRERWRAPEAADAPRVAPPEDRVSIPASGTAAPAAAGGGLRWRETMSGTLAMDGSERATRFTIAISIPDVTAFIAAPSHTGNAAGSVDVAGLTPQGGAPVEGGSFHLFLDEGDVRAREMTYTLPFHDSAGRRWTLRGVKDVRGRRVLDFWRATTTLAVRLEPGDGDAPAAEGRMRLGVGEVARLIASMRPVGAGRRSDPQLIAWRFVRFFGGTLLRLYAAGRKEPGP